MKATIAITASLVAALALSSCGPPPYTMTSPESFKRFEEAREFKYITADGVMLKAREVENYPEASLEFWTAAMEKHLESQGYVIKSRECFETTRKREGCTVDFMLPHGAEDWVLSETLFVVDDTLVLVETAGPYDRYSTVEEELKKALETFEPNL